VGVYVRGMVDLPAGAKRSQPRRRTTASSPGERCGGCCLTSQAAQSRSHGAGQLGGRSGSEFVNPGLSSRPPAPQSARSSRACVRTHNPRHSELDGSGPGELRDGRHQRCRDLYAAQGRVCGMVSASPQCGNIHVWRGPARSVDRVRRLAVEGGGGAPTATHSDIRHFVPTTPHATDARTGGSPQPELAARRHLVSAFNSTGVPVEGSRSRSAMMALVSAALDFRHVDVFTDVPFAGNGLIVVFGETSGVRTEALISLTVEMRQFELIAVDLQREAGRVLARIFTAQEELPFAGHPVIGAAAALHERYTVNETSRSWVFVIGGREIAAGSRRTERYYEADMNQGYPVMGSPLADQEAIRFATALGLAGADLHSLPLQVVSTGLPYLIVPVSRGLERARIMRRRLRGAVGECGGEVCLRV
jgi:hypothetical protein